MTALIGPAPLRFGGRQQNFVDERMERRTIAVRGIVQGVGFRPFVYGLAARLQLAGFVRNETGGVQIEVEGEHGSLDDFIEQLTVQPPPLARIDEVSWRAQSPTGDRQFRIEPSTCGDSSTVVISPDVATCDDCLAELFDPANRRYRYPFLNCTNCGPRLTIVTGAPYDRQRTTMQRFDMCATCRAEYEDPTNRRFHAQPTACADCGPKLALLDAHGHFIETDEPLRALVASLIEGRIAAIKGLGGFHLACDATNAAAVAELRQRKHRNEKPFAVMVCDLRAAEALCSISKEERALLVSSRRPIVLLRRRRSDVHIADEVAPGNPFLGVMLPYTPLHHLLMHDIGDVPLVMTSGNRADEPIAYKDDDVASRLTGIADLLLSHDRPINVRCDDSVTRIACGVESPVRRSRGCAPAPVAVPIRCRDEILAVGGQLKVTFALGRDGSAILSHHVGDLDDAEAYRAFERDIDLYEKVFAIRPVCIAHDLHPDYVSTRYAVSRAQSHGMRSIAVQHHHAHLTSCMAEHGLTGKVIGVSFDGTGFGTDGHVWGGEFLIGDYHEFTRAAHLRYVGMPGGEQAIREPWRMAVSHLLDADCDPGLVRPRLDLIALRATMRMLERRFNTPLTSSAGRLFDAVASLVGVRDRVSHEGQAAMELEWLAQQSDDGNAYGFTVTDSSPNVIDTRAVIASVAEDVARGIPPVFIARRFHTTLVSIILDVCRRIRCDTGIERVTLSGGVFLNGILAEEATLRLEADGFRVFRHHVVPPNDGGLSLGQLSVAAAILRSERS